MALPLEGIRVIEFCEVASGPFCGMMLADMGADVIKVEKPEGDTLRRWPPIREGFSENFASLNRTKSRSRSISRTLTSASSPGNWRSPPTSSSRTTGRASWRATGSTTPRCRR